MFAYHTPFLYLSWVMNVSFFQWNEIKKANSNLVVIGKTALDNDKEDFDADADDDDVDNVEESEGDEFEQEAS